MAWIQRLSGWFAGQPPAAASSAAARVAAPRAVAPIAAPVPALPAAAGDAATLQADFFAWLVEPAELLDATLDATERARLIRLDAAFANEHTRRLLLPRASAVVPQLLNCLRDDSQSADALASRIAKDAHLIAEVIRQANSVGQRGHASAAPIQDLPQAVRRIGISGLQRVVSRVLLRPIFDAQANTLSARVAPRLWAHAEATAEACAELAAAADVDRFDAYLAGLMHNVGWSATFRALDRDEAGVPNHFSRAFVPELARRSERLFATLAQPWQLSPAIDALAVELLAGTARASALGDVLREGDRRATSQLLGGHTDAEVATNSTADAIAA